MVRIMFNMIAILFKVSIHVEKQDNALIADDPVVEGGKIEFSNEFKFEGNASLSLVGKKY